MSTDGQFVAPGLGPLTKAMAVGDAHAVHKAIANAGLPTVIADAHGRSFHPTHTRGVYRSTDGNGGRPGHAVMVIAQHMPAKGTTALKADVNKTIADLHRHLANAPSPLDHAAHDAATSPRNGAAQPTGAQRKAGNYKKGHAIVGTMDISIENPQGSVRRGVGPDGKPWATTLQHHYGYVRGTKGFDKDHLDVFVKPGMSNEMAPSSPVFVIDQKKPNGAFDEHKAMLGFKDKREAIQAYLSNYSAGQEKNIGAITEMPLKKFKEWAASGAPQKGPAARQVGRAPVSSPAPAGHGGGTLRQVQTSLGPKMIDNRYDVASYANSAKDENGPVVVDHSVPEHSPTLKGKDGKPAHLWRYVAEHEVQERKAMKEAVAKFKANRGREPNAAELKKIYEDKHINVATPAERKMVEADGIDFDQYTRTVNGYIKALRDRKHPNPPPFPMHIDPGLANKQQAA